MYKGKHLTHEKPSSWWKSKALLVSLLLVVGITIGGTLAYIVANSDSVENVFTPSEVTTWVDEGVSGNIKSDVMIKNTGDTTAYIRAAVVVTWQDEAGNVLGQKPVETEDYSISYNLSTDPGKSRWIKGVDGFYYWTSPVKSDDEDANNCKTEVLISKCTALQSKTVDGVTYHLAVEIIGSGIQSVPDTVVTEQWKSGISSVSNDGTLTIKQ